MKEYLENFAEQIEDAIRLGERIRFKKRAVKIDSIIICGMGGSGIGGTILGNILKEELKVPLTINKSYTLPSFVNKHTLAIMSSYSGNTEEVLSALNEARTSGAQIVCLSSGGELIRTAHKYKLEYVAVPASFQPRAAAGYMLIELFFILHGYGLIGSKFKKEFKSSANLLFQEENNIQRIAKNTAKKIGQRFPIIYSSDKNAGAAIRFRQELNENAKILASTETVPEMNHNELVGWTERQNAAVIFLEDEDEAKQIKKRFRAMQEVIGRYAPIVIVKSKGSSIIEKTVYYIHVGDWTSFFLSKMRGIDPMNVEVIEYLKARLRSK